MDVTPTEENGRSEPHDEDSPKEDVGEVSVPRISLIRTSAIVADVVRYVAIDVFHVLTAPDQVQYAIIRPSRSPRKSGSESSYLGFNALKAGSSSRQKEDKIVTPRVEFEGESSLSAQAAFANMFLHDAVNSKHPTDITGEMVSVLETLDRTLGNEKNQQDTDYLYPNAIALAPGSCVRVLPKPPIEAVFICLRMAQEHPKVKLMWNHEISVIQSFTNFFLKVYSPGHATQADLIVVHVGLYWLFLECMYVTKEPETRHHFEAQAIISRNNLETILSQLPFHLPSTMEVTLAMSPARKRYVAMLRDVVGEQLQEAFIRTDRVNQLSLSCLIYRAIPPEEDETTAFGGACIASARQALEEHQRSMALVVGMEDYYLEAYINWALLSSPFVPFIVLFCHVIETYNYTLRSIVAESFTAGVKKEVRMSTSLYDVACNYVKLKSGEDPSQLAEVPSSNGWESTAENMNSPVLQPPIFLTSPGPALGPIVNQSDDRNFGGALVDREQEKQEWASGSFQTIGNYPMEVDDYGSQLGNWLYMNNQMIRALENNYCG
ncbi:fungal specific transcription factor [Colletotrichum salicis]|uniref:Fungal specific transcription factor n=1 Tax=Colletotrichum salicis TaxID=1209931 RepID=A0A135TLQ2_9PEZI|nr:fungal specific transcription factor [Colletotrichum salicis]